MTRCSKHPDPSNQFKLLRRDHARTLLEIYLARGTDPPKRKQAWEIEIAPASRTPSRSADPRTRSIAATTRNAFALASSLAFSDLSSPALLISAEVGLSFKKFVSVREIYMEVARSK
jgi:hypothetical protein